MKIKYKTKFNIGDKVVVHDFPHPGWYALGEIYQIKLTVNQFGVVCFDSYTVSIKGHGMNAFGEDVLESVKDFDKKQKEFGLGYDKYLRWLNDWNFAEAN